MTTNRAPQSVSELGHFYDAQAQFKDPFNAVQGAPTSRLIFEHMFDALQAPRFVVTGQVVQGLITRHRGYWNAAEELYEKLPLVGGLMR